MHLSPRQARPTTWAVGIAALAATFVALGPGMAGAQVPRTVEPGESLWSIAMANGMSPEELAAANGLSADAALLSGATVQIPPPAAAGTGICTWDCDSPVHPHPTDEVVSPEAVGEIASRYGMSPPLVQAMATIESGYDNSLVSSAGARGVMQIMPDTWEFIGQQLAGQPLSSVSASANVEAGVIYLHHLYHVSGGDPYRTGASYVQGPNRDEILPEAHDYVERVRSAEAELLGSG